MDSAKEARRNRQMPMSFCLRAMLWLRMMMVVRSALAMFVLVMMGMTVIVIIVMMVMMVMSVQLVDMNMRMIVARMAVPHDEPALRRGGRIDKE